jgi:hypothetical protein
MAETMQPPAARRGAVCAMRRFAAALVIIACTLPAAAGTASADKALQTSSPETKTGAGATGSGGKASGALKALSEGRIMIKHKTLATSQALASASKSTVQPRPQALAALIKGWTLSTVPQRAPAQPPHPRSPVPLPQGAKALAKLGAQQSMSARFKEVHDKAKAHERLGQKAQTFATEKLAGVHESVEWLPFVLPPLVCPAHTQSPRASALLADPHQLQRRTQPAHSSRASDPR